MGSVGKDGHVRAHLGDDRLGRPHVDPRDRVEQVTGMGERGDRRLDLPIEHRDRLVELLDVAEGEADEEGVVTGEAPDEGLAQLGDPPAQAALREVGEDVRVPFARDQGGEHGPSRDAHDLGRDRVEPDAGIGERLLDPLALRHPGPDEALAVAGEVAQDPDRRRRDEAAPQQAVLEELGEPGGVAHVGLAPGQDPDVTGVDEQELEAALLEGVPVGSDVRLAPHPALHALMPVDYATSSVGVAHGEGMTARR